MSRSAARALVAVMLTSACGAAKSTAPDAVIPLQPERVGVWMTTADSANMLTEQPPATLSTATQPAGTPITVDPTRTLQTMVGFGAAMTDASAWLIENRLSPSRRDSLMQELFGRGVSGLGLSFMRLTIGASDFSLHEYSFDDQPAGHTDQTLVDFSIDSNRAYVLPAVKQAVTINPQLTLMASPWSPPGWMKTTGSMIAGTLTDSGYPALARYLVRYVEAYQAEGLRIAAITVQNEPHYVPDNYPGMSLAAPQRTKLLAQYLGPLFAREKITTKILEWDHSWDEPASPLAVLADPTARRYVAGVAWHCYAGDASAQSVVHDAFPTTETYLTECTGGTWSRLWADNLQFFVGKMLIGATRNWAQGAILWNLALDPDGGPHTGGCNGCRGVVTIDAAGNVRRNVEYYALGHFSRFVRPGASRIASTTDLDGVATVAFRNADDGSRVLVAMNTTQASRTLVVHVGPQAFNYVVPAGAVVTFQWS